MAILSLLAKLGLDKTGFDNGLKAAVDDVKSFGKQFAGSFGAAAAAAALAATVRGAVQYADSMQELSERLETTIKLSQEWALAAKLNGEDASFVASNFQKMEKAINLANLGDASSIRSLTALGLSMRDIKTIDVESAMRRASQAINEVGGEADKSAAFLDLFGKSASKMKVVSQDLGTASSLSGIFPTDAEVKNVKAAADAFDVLGTAVKGFFVKALSPGGLAKSALGVISPFLKNVQLPGMKDSLGDMLANAINQKIAGPDKTKEDIQASIESFRRMERMRKVAEDISKLQTDIADNGLSDEEKRNKLIVERAGLMQKIADIEAPGPQNPELRQKAIFDLLKNEAGIVQLAKDGKPAEKSPSRSVQLENTKLGSIGGTLGNSGIRTEQAAVEQVRLTKELKDILVRRGIVIAPNGWR